MRWQFVTTSLVIVASSASAQQPLPAEANVRGALERNSECQPGHANADNQNVPDGLHVDAACRVES